MGPIEKYLIKFESEKILKENSLDVSLQVQAFLDECDRLTVILQDNELFEKERKKYIK
jgi:hypothetical protein